MLAVKTNKNIEMFKSDVAGGFDLKEVISILVGLLLGVGVMLVAIFVFHIPMSVAPYIASLFIAVPILLKFLKPDGMGVKAYREKQKAFKQGAILPYLSTENSFVYSNYGKSYMKKQATIKQTEDDFDHLLRKVKRIGILLIVILIMVVLTIVFIKFL